MQNMKTALYALGVLAGLIGLNAYLVSEAELDEFEIQTVQTMKEFRQEIQQDNQHCRDMDKLDRLNDDYHRVIILMQQYPDNQMLSDEKGRIEAERQRLRTKLGL
jgi:hypothetical protein